MKKTLLALAALTAFAGVASAQSSVTMFGIIEAGARNVKNGSAGSLKTLSTDISRANRFGIRGIEDMGGGLRAGFWLEGQIAADVGSGAKGAPTGSTAGALDWQRRATVSLMGGFGELRLGRDYTPTFYNHVAFDPFEFVGVGAQANLVGAVAGSPSTTTVRANNSIGYLLPAMGGVYGQVMVAAGEGVDANKYTGFRLGYGAGPINVAFAYGTTDTVGNKTKGMNIGGSYDMGFVKPMFQYHKYEFGANTQTNYLVGLTAPMGAGILRASYGKVSDFRSATQIAVGYDYALSKRTSLVGNFSRLNNKGAARYTASNGGPSAAAISGFTSTGYEFGVRHTF
jgi:predicted porin